MDTLLRNLTRVFIALLGLFLLGLLMLALSVYAAYLGLRWLLTGRPPQLVLAWQQLSQLRGKFQNPNGPWRGPQAPAHPPQDDPNVVDVQAKEVPSGDAPLKR